MRCLIHIGLHHTGTTSFQTVLNKNKDYLQKFGIVYPSSSLNGIQHSLLPGCYLPDHHALPKKRSLDTNYYLKQLENEINNKNSKLCILSSEVFNELISIKKESLIELLGKLDDIFEDISILITTRSIQERALSMQKAQIRASKEYKSFRKEIFDGPARFRNKLNGTNEEIKNWEDIGRKIILIKMEEEFSALKLYFKTIFSELNLKQNKEIDYYNKFEKIILKKDIKLNSDSIHPVVYLLLILIGIKISNAEEDLKDKLNIDIVIKFINSVDIRLRKSLFLLNKKNLIYFLENYHLKEYKQFKIERTLNLSGSNFRTNFIIIRLVDEFIYKLILS